MSKAMNREQRRAAAKATPAYRRGMTAEDKMKALFKNGITTDDLKKAGDEGYRDGWQMACNFCMKVCYAAAVRALHQLEGYSTKRGQRFLRVMDDIVVTSMTSEEACDAALKDVGIKIKFDETFSEDRIQEAE